MVLHFRAGLGKADSERVTDFLHLDWLLFHPGPYCQNFALDMIFIDHHAWIVFFAFGSSHVFHSFCEGTSAISVLKIEIDKTKGEFDLIPIFPDFC